jgi:hypothetical protein
VAELVTFAGLSPTGRKIPGPAADLVEIADARGLKHLAWVAHDAYRGHPALLADLQLGWMERPEVTGVARLSHHAPEQSAFVYATGTCFTVAEIVKIYAEEESGAGVKAGLELCYLVGEALSDAVESGAELGVYSHGNINPWTLAIKPDGQPVILAFGLPQVELKVWLEDARRIPKEDSFRYAPPERLEGSNEDVASDLFALSLVALELMVGRPVYDGLLDDIRQQAARGEGMRRLYQWREKLPSNVREVLGRALKPDPDTRYRRPLDFVYAVHDLLGSIDVEGPSLLEVMAKVRAVTKRGKGPIQGGRTGALSPEELRELAADLEEVEQQELPPPRRPRPEPEPDPNAPSDVAPDAPRWRTRAKAEPPPPPPPPESQNARDRLKQRLRSSTGATAEPENPRERLLRRLQPTDDAADAQRRRLRRAVGEDGPRPRRRSTAPGEASQSIELGDPLGFDAADDHTDVALAPVALPDAPPQPSRVTAALGADSRPSRSPEFVRSEAEPSPTEEVEAETTIAPLASSGGAAALLQRLRSSTGEVRPRRRARRSPDDLDGDAPTTMEAPPPEVAALPGPPPLSPRPALTPSPTLAPPTAEVARPVVGQVEREVPAPATAVPASATPDATLAETPPARPPRTNAPRATPLPPITREVVRPIAPWTVRVAGAPPFQLERRADETVAGLVRRAVVEAGLVEVDLSGRVVGWWRAVDPSLPGGVLELIRTPEATQRASIGLPGGGSIELVVPLSVPSGWVAGHLVRWLGLDGAHTWEVDGRRVDVDQPLGDAWTPSSSLALRPLV